MYMIWNAQTFVVYKIARTGETPVDLLINEEVNSGDDEENNDDEED